MKEIIPEKRRTLQIFPDKTIAIIQLCPIGYFYINLSCSRISVISILAQLHHSVLIQIVHRHIIINRLISATQTQIMFLRKYPVTINNIVPIYIIISIKIAISPHLRITRIYRYRSSEFATLIIFNPLHLVISKLWSSSTIDTSIIKICCESVGIGHLRQ